MSWTVGEVAKMAGVSVRTLHHYDEIGLLCPGGRSDGGYRLYVREDLDGLQQVLFFRTLGFPLKEIRRIMDDPEFDRGRALVAQRELLKEKQRRTRAMLKAVDCAIASFERGVPMDEGKMFEGVGDFDPADYEDEVKRRWGETEAYRISARRTKGYGPKDWARIKKEGEGILEALAAKLRAGVDAASAEATGLAEAHRLHIDRWFYPCSREQHRQLARLYVDDPRFRKTFESVQEGLADYVRRAIEANDGEG